MEHIASAGPAKEAKEPARVLGLVDASSVVIGAIVGVGIFFVPSRMAHLVGSGPLLLLAWAIAGVIALSGALTFGALGVRYHSSGAQYEVLRDAYGPLPAFLFVFCNATAIQGGVISIIALVCSQNLAVALGKPSWGAAWQVGASISLIVGLALANMAGVRWGARIQNITVLGKLLTLLTLFVVGLYAPSAPAHAPEPGLSGGAAGVLAALAPALVALGGWQQALWVAGEVKQPEKTLPRAIVGGVCLVIVAYMLVNIAYLRLLGGAAEVASSKTLAADAVARVAPGVGGRIIAGAVAASAFGVLNAQLLSGPRLLFRMAQDGRFFAPFSRLGAKSGTPWPAIALLAAVALVLLVAAGEKGVDRLLTGVAFIDGVFFLLTGAALFVLRGKRGADFLKVPGYPILPLLFVLGEIGVVVGTQLDPAVLSATFIGAGWIGAGALLYFWRFRGA